MEALCAEINKLINELSKTRWILFIPNFFKKVVLVARRKKHFWGFCVIFFVAQLPWKSVLVHKNSLASCQWCRHSVEAFK